MHVTFQSLQSGSSGNCLLIRRGQTQLLIDAGYRSQRACHEALDGLLPELAGVVVSHLHSDHISYSALRVLEEAGVPVYVYQHDVDLLRARHFNGRALDGLEVRPYTETPFCVGDVQLRPFGVPHVGEFGTFGFEATADGAAGQVRLVIATDLWDYSELLKWFLDAHFIYVESNHDGQLLRENPNPNSRFHLRNVKCGWLLLRAFDHSRTLPAGVMLGHLSHERNTPELARETIRAILERGGYGHVPIHIAPRFTASEQFTVQAGG